MSIPKYDQMYRSFLKSLEDGKVHPYIDAKRQVIKDFKLSEEDVSEMLENGKQKKIYVMKYKSKKNEKKKIGHRQPFTKVQIVSIKG